MKDLLERLKLVQHFTIEMEIEKSVFISILKEKVDEGDTSVIFSAFEVFSTSKNEYKGSIGLDGFKLRKRRKFFDMNMNLAIANGSYQQKDNILVIETQINGFHGMFIPYYIFVPFFYVIFFFVFFVAENTNEWWFILPFMTIHAALMLGIPYFIIRRSVYRMMYELERDFYFMTRK